MDPSAMVDESSAGCGCLVATVLASAGVVYCMGSLFMEGGIGCCFSLLIAVVIVGICRLMMG